MKRVFVGTMYCGEGDFAACCQAISTQQGVEIEHVVISDLPEKAAHNALWAAWRSRQSSFDLFVKVDADTVLRHNRIFTEVASIMEQNPRITRIQAPLHDYFTDGFINGLNCFSPKVIFRDTTDDLFCDRVDVGHDIVLNSTQVPESLSPAGFHCHQATDVQAFHFGVHRALKGQQEIIQRVKHAWLKQNDRLRAFALIGAQCAPIFHNNFNYTDHAFADAFEDAKRRYDTLITKL